MTNNTIDLIISLEKDIADLKRDCVKICNEIEKEIRDIKEMTKKIFDEEVI